MDLLSGALNGMPWPAVGFGGLRLWDAHTNWTWLNPSRGVYDWSVLDPWLALAQSHQLDILYTFGVTPAWAAANPTLTCAYHPGACSPPADLGDWQAFVRALVVHSHGRIKYWELWNEPNLTESWTGDAGTLALMAQQAYAIIKSVDPDAVVLTPAPTAVSPNSTDWLTNYFAAGGGDYADAIAFHGYLPADADVPESLVDVVASMNTLITDSGQTGKPLWDTEASWGTPDLLPDLDAQAAYVARSYLLHWSLGVQRFYWYAWNSPLWGSLWDPSAKTILKPGIAYRETYDWLVGATLTSPCSVDGDSTWTCFLSRPGGYDAEIIWNIAAPGSSTRLFSVSQHFAQYRDLDGNVNSISGSIVPIGSKPILLEPFTNISLSRPVLKFSSVPVGSLALSRTLVVTNTGAVPLLIARREVTGDYTLLDGCGDSVLVGASCQIQISFLPAAPGTRTGTLTIRDNAPGAPHTVFLTNTNPANPILFSPSTVDFSNRMIGAAPVSKNVTLTNIGDQVVTIAGPTMGGTTGSGFVVSANTCSATLVPGGDCAVTVTFAPKDAGAQTTALQAIDIGVTSASVTVPVSGTGWDFSLTSQAGAAASILPNRSGSYGINVTPLGGFMGTVALVVSCNVPGIASCAVTPSSVAITDASPVPIYVQVNTVSSAQVNALLGVIAVFLCGMAFYFRSLPALALGLMFLIGCTGVTGKSIQNTPGPNASGLTTVVVTGISQGGTRTLNLPVSPP